MLNANGAGSLGGTVRGTMDGSENANRFEAALASPQPSEALHAFASALKREGMAQEGILDLFTDFLQRHQDDADERLYDAIADTMEHIHYHFQHL